MHAFSSTSLDTEATNGNQTITQESQSPLQLPTAEQRDHRVERKFHLLFVLFCFILTPAFYIDLVECSQETKLHASLLQFCCSWRQWNSSVHNDATQNHWVWWRVGISAERDHKAEEEHRRNSRHSVQLRGLYDALHHCLHAQCPLKKTVKTFMITLNSFMINIGRRSRFTLLQRCCNLYERSLKDDAAGTWKKMDKS